MATHKLTKKDLKHDSFIENTEKGLEYLQRHAMPLGIGLLVIVVLIVGGTYVARSRATSAAQSSYLLYQGEDLLASGAIDAARGPLQECVDRYGDSDSGRLARVSLAKAYLAAGENDAVLTNVETWLRDVPDDHPADRALRVARAAALSALGRHTEAAAAYAELAAAPMDDADLFDLTVRQADSLRAAGQAAEALRVLEALDARRARGEIKAPPTSDLRTRLDVMRALAG